jgi:pyruvate dehydrogenase E2 component (dihydrolipoamide acetyltransferase)
VEVPILAVWGREDAIVPHSHTDNLPEHARVEILDDTGHMPQMEAAGKVNRLIGESLNGSGS